MESENKRNRLNGDGEEYTPAQLKELHEYLDMLADMCIEIYYEDKLFDRNES